ncbi:hypothetical protein ZIOFF_021135 [Zingiber officinale]|uniref:Leucine-rich repeat-containing N-terminal plant-type domain-containing protein n=1 Tax=Zingiber officinale TaxID=94328 RepID=A0A8J5HB01_ZINOF|nr:hypothetical protein ZIOFF_021135 [Zingiber officinale]
MLFELLECHWLFALDLRFNSFNGTIPTSFENLSHISQFKLQENDFSSLSSNLILPPSVNSTRNSSYPSRCRWAGISCDRSGYVTSIELPVLRISDSLGKEIGLLRHLKKLNLAANDLSGFIPSELGNCTLLEHLKLSNNFLSRLIPMTIDDLAEMDVSQNDLEGNISFSNALNSDGIALLALSRNLILPPSVNSTRNSSYPSRCRWGGISCDRSGYVTSIELPVLRISDSLGKEIGLLRCLKKLNLAANDLSRFIPSELGNCTLLEHLKLSNNFLSAMLNSDGIALLALSSNLILPPSVNSTRNSSYPSRCRWAGISCDRSGYATSIELPVLRISDSLGKEIGLLRCLKKLNLAANDLSRFIPSELGNCTLLEHLKLSNNFLSEIWLLGRLKKLNLAANDLSGFVPSELGDCTLLEHLKLSNNFLSGNNMLNGTIPPGLANFSSLKRLVLSHNNLSDSIPEFFVASNLLYIDLSFNKRNGQIPQTVGNIVNLTMINLSMNKLDGPIPRQIENLSNLQLLNLFNNNLKDSMDEDSTSEALISKSNGSPNPPSTMCCHVRHNPIGLRCALEATLCLRGHHAITPNDVLASGMETPTLQSVCTLIISRLLGAPLDGSSEALSSGVLGPGSVLASRVYCRKMQFGANHVALRCVSKSDQRRWKQKVWPWRGGIQIDGNALNSDGIALLALSSNLILPQSVNSTRNSSDPSPCRWAGISYNRSGYVTSIELPVLRISDSLGKEIGLNRRLKKLNLVANDLSRFIPSELGNCTLLEHLKLSNNFLSGEIPVTLQNLEKLSNLALYENSLSGNIPSLLFQRPSLEIIYLNDNNLNGSIPSFNANACNVKLLQLGQNNLSGTLPYSIGNCSELQ